MRILKNEHKPHILSYTRDDGSETWMHASEYFVRHDLSHYALEKILHYKTAFNGMLNNGMDIRDFEDKEKRASLNVTAEAYYAENMANLFLIEIAEGNFTDFNAVQQQAFVSFNQQYEPVAVPQEKIEMVRSYLRELLQQWQALPVGDTLTLTFSL